jgi:hypothetical protein
VKSCPNPPSAISQASNVYWASELKKLLKGSLHYYGDVDAIGVSTASVFSFSGSGT